MGNLIITLTGHTCSGKNFLLEKLVEHGYEKLVSSTTRDKRNGEVDGEDYHFITKFQFELGMNGNEFIEHIEINDRQYGLSVKEIESKVEPGKDKVFVVILDPEGVTKLKEYLLMFGKKHNFGVLTFFVKTPKHVRMSRLIDRTCYELDGPKSNRTIINSLIDRVEHMRDNESEWDKFNFNVPLDGEDSDWALETVDYHVKSFQRESKFHKNCVQNKETIV